MNKKSVIGFLLCVVVLVIVIICFFLMNKNNTSLSENNEINIYDYYSGQQNVDVTENEKIYLWEKGNIPTVTEYKQNTGNYFDEPDFMPYMTMYKVPDNTEIKGAMLISPGGAFMLRSENKEGLEVAEEFAKKGYVSFVVHYRVRPYTEEESGIDIARAIKYVRSHSKDLGIDENKIGVVGFSAGGIANGHAVLKYNELTNATKLDKDYKTDSIDNISATPNAVIQVYSFYGRLSVADLNKETFENFDLPPTYYVYGTEDPFYRSFNAQVELLKELNKNIESKVLQQYPHGFGIGGNWIDDIDNWLIEIFK